jgi:1,4-alpha-glucan branching enzyme
VVTLPEGSWGQGEHHYIWLNRETEWTWKHIYDDEIRMKHIAARIRAVASGQPLLKRAAAQAMRELLLLQASDWQFLISTVSARDYAELRFSEHHQDFNRLGQLTEILLEGEEAVPGEIEFLENCEERDGLFPDADPSLYLDK